MKEPTTPATMPPEEEIVIHLLNLAEIYAGTEAKFLFPYHHPARHDASTLHIQMKVHFLFPNFTDQERTAIASVALAAVIVKALNITLSTVPADTAEECRAQLAQAKHTLAEGLRLFDEIKIREDMTAPQRAILDQWFGVIDESWA